MHLKPGDLVRESTESYEVLGVVGGGTCCDVFCAKSISKGVSVSGPRFSILTVGTGGKY